MPAGSRGYSFPLMYGIEIMADAGMPIHTIRAGYANMFMSLHFSQSLANISNAQIELEDTDGAGWVQLVELELEWAFMNHWSRRFLRLRKQLSSLMEQI